MQVFNDRKERIGILKGFKNRKIVKTLDSGDRELTFEYPASGKMVDRLKEEYYIRTKEDEYVIRKRKTGSKYNEYTAQLNVEELEGAVFPYGFESNEQTIRACLEFAFEGTGWKVGTCQITKRRTINKGEATNAWEVLQDCLSTYRAECKINSLKKTIDIYEQIGADRGRYFIEGLNLKKLTVTSDTYDFYTRLIPLGKDGIGIELNGKAYLENYQYSKKVKTYVWSDERYTNPDSLIEDGLAKLEEMSKPYAAYAADVVDLAKQSEKYSSVFDYDIGDTVWMVSKKTRTKEKQRIVKITEYPEEPQKNTVELSNVTKTYAAVQQAETDKAKNEAVKMANMSAKKTLNEGYYTSTEVDTKIGESKDEIALLTSETYETKKNVEEKIKSANELTDQKLEEKIKSVNELTDQKLEEYSTVEHTNEALAAAVKYEDLTEDGRGTTISGKNLTEGIIADKTGNASWDLESGALKANKINVSGSLEGEDESKVDFAAEVNGQTALALHGKKAVLIQAPVVYASSGEEAVRTFTGTRDGHEYINGLMIV
nr:MAG TPA: tail protein [Caudoviricetes sp.]